MKLETQIQKNSSKVYEITDKRKVILMEKIEKILSTREKIISPLDLGISNMNILSNDQVVRSFDHYVISLDSQIDFLDKSIEFQKENNIPYNFIAIFSRSSAVLKAEKIWIKEFLEKLKDNKKF